MTNVKLLLLETTAQSAGTVEYTECFPTEE